MKNIRKVSHKLKSVTLSALCTLLLCTLFVFPARGETLGGACGESLSWELTGSVLTITGSGAMTEYRDGNFAPWHEMRDRIITVSLPDGLTTIGKYAFLNCEALASLRVPDTVTRIGEYAFAECKSLRLVQIGSGISEISEGAFSACEALSGLTLPEGLQKIGLKAFYRCASLPAVTIPSSVTAIGPSTFGYCYALTRATVLAPLAAIPSWMFYGCENLVDVSLAAGTVGVGEYAFERCGNLSTIYSAASDDDILSLEESLRRSGGDGAQNAVVSIGTMPALSTASSATDTSYSDRTVRESDNSTITVSKDIGEDRNSNTVTAVIRGDSGFGELSDAIDGMRRDGVGGSVESEIQLPGGELSGDDLDRLAGENVSLTVRGEDDTVWKLDMAEMSHGDLSGRYRLGASLSDTTDGETTITARSVRRLGFAGSTDFNTTLGIRVGDQRRVATLYQRSGKEYQQLQSVVIDDDGMAWFNLANIDDGTDYYLAIDADGIDAAEAVIPATLTDEYGINATLSDGRGTQYQVTGRTSRWGITGGQFAVYAGIVIGAAVLIVSLIMITLHRIARSKAKYAVPAGSVGDQPDEETLRLEVMQEMLNEKKKGDAARSRRDK